MDAQAAADAGNADQPLHKFRFLLLQLGKLIGDDEQMGHRFVHLPAAVQPLIGIDIHRPLVRDMLDLIEYSLAAGQLTLDGYQSPLDRGAIQVGDGSHQMGQMNSLVRVIEGTGQASALIVDEHKGHLIGVIVHSHGQNIRDQEFTFAGAGHTGHQSVGSLELLVQVQLHQLAAGAYSHRGGQGLHGVAFAPPLHRVQILHPPHTEHFQKGHGFGQRIRL